MSPWLRARARRSSSAARSRSSRGCNLLGIAVALLGHVRGGIGVLALSGHAMSANWHLGPVSDGYFWKVLILSPEVFVFLSFMITDPKTVPDGPHRRRRLYAVGIGLLAALLIAPQQTEFGAKVALLGSLTLVCAARPILILLGEATAAQRGMARRAPALGFERLRAARRGAIGAGALARRPRRSSVAARARRHPGPLRAPEAGAVGSDAGARRAAGDDLGQSPGVARDRHGDGQAHRARRRRRPRRRGGRAPQPGRTRAAVGASGAWLGRAADADPRRGRTARSCVPTYRIDRAHISSSPATDRRRRWSSRCSRERSSARPTATPARWRAGRPRRRSSRRSTSRSRAAAS